ncbi:hypothetical protein NECAME_09834 [Necator americanus]|uniref:Uncharacterized protein n=1 Tax=Necator americanus TaxID=51031 RepID=W2TE12_NECAM|nr:hypothetical protein NECAME_09834 [Necator americanus]ETN79431.1 hypothetical protein NECAME_09834 [Necator americanus]
MKALADIRRKRCPAVMGCARSEASDGPESKHCVLQHFFIDRWIPNAETNQQTAEFLFVHIYKQRPHVFLQIENASPFLVGSEHNFVLISKFRQALEEVFRKLLYCSARFKKQKLLCDTKTTTYRLSKEFGDALNPTFTSFVSSAGLIFAELCLPKTLNQDYTVVFKRLHVCRCRRHIKFYVHTRQIAVVSRPPHTAFSLTSTKPTTIQNRFYLCMDPDKNVTSEDTE